MQDIKIRIMILVVIGKRETVLVMVYAHKDIMTW